MNAGPTDTRNPHLDLGDLIAGAAGQPVGDRAREHLAVCEHCQLEAKRWGLVADGVRGLAAAVPEAAQPAWPQGTRKRFLAPWQRGLAMVAGAAAALILLVGIGAALGVVHVHLSTSSSQPTLTGVTGCDELEQANGTLRQVNGSDLVIQTANGQLVTVTTTPSTFLSMSGPLVDEITDGASVEVRGNRSDGTIQAAIVTVGQPFSAVNPQGLVPVQGTVSDAGTAEFTLVTTAGTRIPVTTSGSTLVIVPHASPSQLKAGTPILAVGKAGPGGTLSAQAVAAVTQLSSGGHVNAGFRVRNCSSSSIVEALGAISAAPAATP